MGHVPVISLPPVPYDATAIRPGWGELPAELRAGIEGWLGGPVTAVRPATAGFTRGFTAVLDTGPGRSTFVKAAPVAKQPHLVDWYAREAAILARLPDGLPVPRPRWTLSEAGWFALGLDAVDGRLPGLPWNPAELSAALAAYAEVAAALADPPAELVALGLPRLADLARDDLAWWREIATGHEPRPDLPPGLTARVPELVELESLLPGYVATGGLIHCDLRLDNVLVDHTGRAWICDWNWLCHGPAWFDLAGLLLTAYASGLDADALFVAHPAAAGAPPDAPDAVLAALAGYFLTSAASGPTSASPHVRSHQRFSGKLALDWLAARQGWH